MKIVLLMGAIFLCIACNSTHAQSSLYAAIKEVETGGGIKPGDQGMSNGPYQIQRAYWEDACQYGGLDWEYSKYVNSEKYCRVIMDLYAQRYKARSDEERAKLHNGGPRWRKLPKVNKYWEKVERFLKEGL